MGWDGKVTRIKDSKKIDRIVEKKEFMVMSVIGKHTEGYDNPQLSYSFNTRSYPAGKITKGWKQNGADNKLNSIKEGKVVDVTNRHHEYKDELFSTHNSYQQPNRIIRKFFGIDSIFYGNMSLMEIRDYVYSRHSHSDALLAMSYILRNNQCHMYMLHSEVTEVIYGQLINGTLICYDDISEKNPSAIQIMHKLKFNNPI